MKLLSTRGVNVGRLGDVSDTPGGITSRLLVEFVGRSTSWWASFWVDLVDGGLMLVHWFRRLGRQLWQVLLAFTQAQFLQCPLLLHLQHTTILLVALQSLSQSNQSHVLLLIDNYAPWWVGLRQRIQLLVSAYARTTLRLCCLHSHHVATALITIRIQLAVCVSQHTIASLSAHAPNRLFCLCTTESKQTQSTTQTEQKLYFGLYCNLEKIHIKPITQDVINIPYSGLIFAGACKYLYFKYSYSSR